MKKIALISVTSNAITPVTDYIKKTGIDFSIINYLDAGLMSLVERDGQVNDRSLTRLISLIALAVEDNADAVLLTCTVFSPYIDRLKTLFKVPIFSADLTMIQQAVKTEGRTIIICTFPATMESTASLFHDEENKLGVKRDMKLVLLKNAYDAMQKGNRQEHDSIILEAVRNAEKDFDAIMLAQISMAHVAELATDCSKPILTSPESAVNALIEALK